MLMQEIRFSAIRGNASEIHALAEGRRSARGVDTDAEVETGTEMEREAAFLKAFSAQTGCVIAMTGAVDLVADDSRCFLIRTPAADEPCDRDGMPVVRVDDGVSGGESGEKIGGGCFGGMCHGTGGRTGLGKDERGRRKRDLSKPHH